MMELDRILESRQSIRKYLDRSVTKEQVEAILRAAALAPSWKNSQTRRYHVVMSGDLLREVKEKALPSFNGKNVADAPVLIVSTYVRGVSGYLKPGGEAANALEEGWGAYDLGLADENLMLKARELGLDTLVMGLRHEEVLRELLDIPGEEIVVSVIGLGYRDGDPAERRPRKPVEEIAKFY